MTIPILFDRKRLGMRRARAARDFVQHDFLVRAAQEAIAESLASITRIFPRIVTFGAALPARRGTEHIIRCDRVRAMLQREDGLRVVVDEEWLPFAENSIDAIVSVWGLHWVNDVPGALSQIRRALKPDGLFLAVLPGAETLRELRGALAQAETTLKGGISPRVAPFPDVREAGALLQRTGFSLPVASSETLTVSYPNMRALMHDLRGMGETNVLTAAQKSFSSRTLFAHAEALYAAQHHDGQGRLHATFELIILTGWKT